MNIAYPDLPGLGRTLLGKPAAGWPVWWCWRVGLRGPGETQLEVDRRDIRRRIDHLKAELEKSVFIANNIAPDVSVLGCHSYSGWLYNAGKSTLLNRLAKADVYVADQLFATLDPTTRRLSCQVGISHYSPIPLDLFRTSNDPCRSLSRHLEEITEADLLIHVVDITHANAQEQAASVHQTSMKLAPLIFRPCCSE